MLYHLGALRRLSELGVLSQVDRVSSVSGGSITAGVLAVRWSDLDFDLAGVARNFETVERAVFDLAGHTIDWPGAIRGLSRKQPAGIGVAAMYDRYLFKGQTLQDLPDTPRFVFNTTNMLNGNLLRWSKPYAADYAIGQIKRPTAALAVVVAASSAFPPFLSPLRIDPPGTFVDFGAGLPIADPPAKLWLADGGVYDNLGLQTADSFSTVFASDGGSPLATPRRVHINWLSQSLRTTLVIDAQVRRLRRHALVEEFQSGSRSGTLWTINTLMSNYTAPDVLACASDRTQALASIGTRLAALPRAVRYAVANWGYASADAAVRSYVDPSLPAPAQFPYPGGIG
jgi:NTE family protein